MSDDIESATMRFLRAALHKLTAAPEEIEKKIERRGNKFVVLSEDGSKTLGSFDTREEAVARLRQIEGHKKEMPAVKDHDEDCSCEDCMAKKKAMEDDDEEEEHSDDCTCKACMEKKKSVEKAELTSGGRNSLPDSAFAIILPGGKKDEDGKTAPRSLRMFPYKRADGSIDKAHLRNALARINQNNRLSAEQKAKVKSKLQAAARSEGIGEAAEKEFTKWALEVPFAKADEEKRLVTGVVMEPGVIDLQGDFTDEHEIETAAHAFMQKSRVVGKGHEARAKAEVVESYIASDEMQVGGQRVRKGSWVMTVKVHDEDLWKEIKGGGFTGFSIGGRSMKLADQEIEVEDEE